MTDHTDPLTDLFPGPPMTPGLMLFRARLEALRKPDAAADATAAATWPAEEASKLNIQMRSDVLGCFCKDQQPTPMHSRSHTLLQTKLLNWIIEN